MSENRSILFFSKAPMNYVMFRRVAERLMKDNRIQLDVLAQDDDRRSLRDSHIALGLPADCFVSRLKARLKRYDLYLSADIQVVGKRARQKAHIFHGISFKGKAYTRKILRYDKAFLIGPYQQRMFAEKGFIPHGSPVAVPIGMPKIDPIVNGEFQREEVLARLGVAPEKPVVLYAPTWRKEASLNTMGPEILDAVAGMQDITFLIKLHDLCLDPRINRRDWGKFLDEKEGEGLNFIFVRDSDITPYLAVADLLISDASSTANEFLLRDRPIIFMDVPLLFGKYSQTIDLETWGRKTGRVVGEAAALPGVIREELANPQALSEVRQAAARDYFYNPGRATEAAVAEIYRLLELQEL